ncbi:MAG: roadblock/LC7 domain-containing protein, partial [Thermomicrobium sp.]
ELDVTFGELVQRVQKEYGLEAALVVTTDGLVVDAATASGSEIDTEAIAANAVSGLLMLEALGQEFASTPRQAIIEFDRHLVLIAPLDQDTALVLVATGSANLGRLRLAIRRLGTLTSQATPSASV